MNRIFALLIVTAFTTLFGAMASAQQLPTQCFRAAASKPSKNNCHVACVSMVSTLVDNKGAAVRLCTNYQYKVLDRTAAMATALKSIPFEVLLRVNNNYSDTVSGCVYEALLRAPSTDVDRALYDCVKRL